MSWTDDRVARAKALWLSGWTATDIAADLGGGVTRNAVIGKIQRLGLLRNSPAAPSVARPQAPRVAKPARPPKPAPVPEPAKAPTVFSWGKGSAAVGKAPDLETVRRAEETDRDPATLKSFAEKGRDECSWPIGAPDPVRGQLFCGRPTAFRKSYCPCHGGPQVAGRRPYRVKDLGLAAERPMARSRAAETDVVDLVETFR